MSVFSKISEDKKIYSGEYFFMIYDGYPVSPGHILIISNEEKLDFFSLN
jgi:diadenosine tetraphosphate (Ap4A) HIT family hydrolase